ncbi:MAG: molybdenum cofactor guanylyltransferase [Deltaproteobacteria bacterium]|nr:molybdenum cofactor guanylyltransferase [Deltaproteobacteria bacterium]
MRETKQTDVFKQPVTGIILSGGKSNRLGGLNKAFIEIRGERLIEKTLRLYRELFEEILIVTNSPLDYLEFDVKIVTDIIPGKASLGGIYTGLFFANSEYAFVTACDMPFLNAQFIRSMMEKTGQHDIIIPRSADGLQPLHAIYSRKLLKPIRRLIDADHLKITELFKKSKVLEIPREEILSFDPEERLFMNINTPEDLEKLADK